MSCFFAYDWTLSWGGRPRRSQNGQLTEVFCLLEATGFLICWTPRFDHQAQPLSLLLNLNPSSRPSRSSPIRPLSKRSILLAMSIAWNPRAILDVYPERAGFHCVGTAKTTGVRCRNSFISHALLAEASTILDSLPEPGRFRANPDRLLPTLTDLAWLTLCPRWHKRPGANYQADSVAQRWLRTILAMAYDRSARLPRSAAPSPSLLSPSATPLTRSSLRLLAGISSTTQSESTGRQLLTPPPSPPRDPAVSRHTPSDSESTMTERPAHRNRTSREHSSSASPPSPSTPPNNTSTRQSRHEGGVSVNVDIVINTNRAQQSRSHSQQTATNNAAPPIQSSRVSTPSTPSISTQYRTSSIDCRTSATDQPAIYNTLRVILERLESMEARLNASTRSSSRSSRTMSQADPGAMTPASPTFSTTSSSTMPLPFIRTSHPHHNLDSSARSHSSTMSSTASQVISTPTSSGSSSPISTSPVRSGLIIAGNKSARSVQRRAINANTTCYACHQPITGPNGAVWCRASCGQNCCRECFGTWTANQIMRGNVLLCGFWYVTSWFCVLRWIMLIRGQSCAVGVRDARVMISCLVWRCCDAAFAAYATFVLHSCFVVYSCLGVFMSSYVRIPIGTASCKFGNISHQI